jgi:transposase
VQTITVVEAELQHLAHLLVQVVQAKRSQLRAVQLLVKEHPDCSSFSCLPGAGARLAPALPSTVADDRRGFPNAESVQALAGTGR